MAEDIEAQKVRLLREMLKWIKVTSIPEVKKLLETTLTTPEQRIAYTASDGKNAREVASIAHVNKSAITRWWAIWVKLGLAEIRPVRGGDRAIRSFSLEDFGVDVPKPDSKHTKSESRLDSS